MAPIKSEIVQKLSQLNLSGYPVREIHGLIQQLGRYGAIVTTFGPGKEIVRARVNLNGEEFSKVSDLSYKPARFNSTYQRASTPNTTMFYGAVIPEHLKPDELDRARVIGCAEASTLMRNKLVNEGEEKMTFGKWIVINEIHLVSIVHHADYLRQNSLTKQMHDDYNNFIRAYPPEMVEDSLMISEFFADQFAKEEILNDYDYLLSAIYAERITRMVVEGITISGVLYPSVRTEGKGFNIALTPACADNNLRLTAAVECSVYKKEKMIFVDNDKITELKEGQTEFNLVPMPDPEEHSGRSIAEKILNQPR